MIKYGIKVLAAILACAFLSGCNLFGPSEKEVKQAMEAVFRAFEESTRQDNPEVRNAYSNAADLIFENEQASLLHEMSVLVDEGELSVTGNCAISDHEDPFSNYLISGELSYEMTFRKDRSRDIGSGTMSGELTLAGGEIQSLEFSFDLGDGGELENFLVIANGKNIDFAREEKAFNFLRGLGSRLPG